MIEAFKEALDLVFNSGFFAAWLSMFMFLIAVKIALCIFRYVEFDGFTFQKESDTREEEITYETLYDDELLDLMAKYDEMDKQHKKDDKKYQEGI